MAYLAGDVELPAQHRHFLTYQQPGYEFKRVNGA
jgi:hypothetical protein